MDVVFQILNFLKIVFGSTELFHYLSGQADGWAGRWTAEDFKNKANSVLFQVKLQTGTELGNKSKSSFSRYTVEYWRTPRGVLASRVCARKNSLSPPKAHSVEGRGGP
jgi:hypothetical protein